MKDSSINILIIEDYPEHIKLVSRMLENCSSQSFNLASAGRLDEGISIIASARFDAILLDLTLPDSYGLEGLEKISSQFPDIPVIVLTALDDESMELQAMQKNSWDYLVKGQINTNLLVHAIRYAIERKKKENELRNANRILSALSESSQAMLYSQNETSYLRQICRIIVKNCGYSAAWVGYRVDDEGKTIRPMAYHGVKHEYMETVCKTWEDSVCGNTPAGMAIRTGKLCLCQNIDSCSWYKPWVQETIEHGYSSAIAIPLKTRDGAFGAITAFSDETNPFTEKEVQMLSEISADLVYGISAIKTRNLQEKTEKELKESERRMAALLNATTESIWLMNTDGCILASNEIAAKRLGLNAEFLKGKIYFDYLPGSVAKTRRHKMEEVINTGKPLRFQDERSGLIFSHSLFPVRDESGNIQSIAVFSNDITDSKRVEEVLQRDKDTLEKMVQEQAHEYSRAQIELERARRLSDIGRLASTVAHELRNPLATIKTAVFNIQRKAGSPLIERHIANINKKILESDAIIQNVLNFSKVKVLNIEKVALKPLLVESCNNISGNYKKNKVSLKEAYLTKDDCVVEGDQSLLQSLFSNILDNAFQSMDKKSGKIDLRVDSSGDNYYEIIIEDNGVGIDEENISKIYEPFFTTRSRGTGLGLSVCREIVERHYGKIDIKSKKGSGTTVKITLPILQLK